MSGFIRRELSKELAKTFLDDIQFRRSRYYYFLGGVEPWNGVGGTPNEDVVPSTPLLDIDSVNRNIRANMLYARLIQPNEVSLVVRKIDWISGQGYDQWDHTLDMSDKDFYVVNSENRVYKCLYNNTGFDQNGITPSTVEPIGTSIYPIKLSDGYIWKYMYSISAYANTKFRSFNYMPVQRALSESFYNNGAVDDVVVLNNGSGYSDSLLTTITVSGTTTGSGAAATFTVNSFGAIDTITVTDGGSGYTKGVRISVTSSVGAGAVLTPVITGGVITDITITQSGVSYDPLVDTIEFNLGGAVLVPSVSRVTGSITKVTIVDPGVGYTTAPTLTVVGDGGLGTGLYGNPTALISAIEHNGSIAIVNIQDPGQDYPADNATIITAQGDGENAEFSPVIYDGRIVDVVVENAGEKYTNILVNVVGDGTGASLQGIITQSDYNSDQSVVEQTAVDGAIYAIEVTNGGQEYAAGTTISIEGNGTGFEATPVIVGGVITKVNITSYGSGYTWATITFNNSNLDVVHTLENGKLATAYAILPPIGGHGKDAPVELLSTTIGINTSLRNELSVQSIDQDFRTFGILKNPKNLITGAEFSQQSALLAFKMAINTTVGLVYDEILLLRSSSTNYNRFRVIDYSNLENYVILSPIDKITIVPVGVLEAETESLRQYNTTTTLQTINMNKYSGTMMYVAREVPFEFSETQSIIIKTFIKF